MRITAQISDRSLALVLFVAAVAIRLPTLLLGTDVDTGCFYIMIRAMAEGKALYRDIFCNYTPLTFGLGRFLYAVSPEHFPTVTRVFMVAATASCVLPIFWVGRALFGRRTGCAAALLFATSTLVIFYSRQLHVCVVEMVTSTWAAWVLLLALRARQRRWLWDVLAGAVVALPFMARQSSALMLALYPLLIVFSLERPNRWFDFSRILRRLLPYLLGVLLVMGSVLLYLMAAGLLEDFIADVVTGHFELRESTRGIFNLGSIYAKLGRWARVASRDVWLWLFAGFGLILGLRKGNHRLLVPLLWLMCFMIFMFLFYYENVDHYFLVWIPPASLLGGYGLVQFLRLSAAPGRPPEGAVALLVMLVLVLGWAALKFLDLGRLDFALFVGASASIIGMYLAVHTVKHRSAKAVIVSLCAVALAVCVALPYWTQRGDYAQPHLHRSEERAMALWLRKARSGDEDVAMLACDVMTIEGGWRELPVIRRGKPMIAPMAIDCALRNWSPDPELLAETVRFWESDFDVQYLVLYGAYNRVLSTTANRPLQEYLTKNFQLREEFDWDRGDYYSSVFVFVRKTKTEDRQ